MTLTALLTMTGLGIFFAGVLAFANRRFRLEEDPRVEELSSRLSGLNCGACGFPSCYEFAKRVLEDKEVAMGTTCRAAGPEVSEYISKMAGVTGELPKETAVVFCGAKDKDKTKNAVYKGIETCRSADLLFGGGVNCGYGCLGYGDCVRACIFDAMKMSDGLPKIDPGKCVACGKCVSACCRNIIEIVPCDADDLVVPACRSKDRGAYVRKICAVGCIACKICEKLSNGVVYVEENLAKLAAGRIKENVNWDEVIKKCPTDTMVKVK